MVPGTRGYHLDAFLSRRSSRCGPSFASGSGQTRTGSKPEAWPKSSRFQTGQAGATRSNPRPRKVSPRKPCARPAGRSTTPTLCPPGAAVLIGACDVQDNRLEAEISAWGLTEVERDDASQLKGWGSHEFRGLQHEGRWYRLRRWALEYRRFHGDPGTVELWEKLAEFMEQPRPHATGPLLRPVSVGIDIGGHFGPQVADFVKDRGAGYQCIKGLPPQRYGAVLARRFRHRRQPGKLRSIGLDAGLRERR